MYNIINYNKFNIWHQEIPKYLRIQVELRTTTYLIEKTNVRLDRRTCTLHIHVDSSRCTADTSHIHLPIRTTQPTKRIIRSNRAAR